MNPDYQLPAQKFQFKTKPQTNQKWERKERDPQFMKPVESGKINVKCVNSIFVNFTSHDIWLTPMKVLWKIKPPDFSEFTKSKDYSYYAKCSRRVGKGGSAHQKLLEIQVDKGNTI